MKRKLTWKRWIVALTALAVCSVLFLLTMRLIFFILGLVLFFVILIAAYIG
ncbi:MAG: hypothetical protein IKQ73_08855 [Oscillospiraceae bacterium]|nr:hypothetical protein [Oscillospiraceae bacterium]